VIKGIHVVSKRTSGKPIRWYVYAFRGGPLVHSCIGPKRPSLDTEILRRIAAARETSERRPTDTLCALIRSWRPASPEWIALAKNTQKTWGSATNLIDDKWGATPISVWSDPRMVSKVVAWRDSRSATPRVADTGVAVLRALLEFGRLRGKVAINVAQRIPQLYRNGTRAEIVWTDGDMAAFALSAAQLGCVHVNDGLRLAALTGLRRADLVTLTWDQVGDSAISKLALKQSRGRRRRVTMPRIPALDSLLDELRSRKRQPGVNNLLVNSYGRPWSGDGFGTSFNRVRDHAGIVHIDSETNEAAKKHLHDVRGTFCTKLVLAGLSNQDAADIMGWSPEQVAGIRRCYVDQSSVVVAIGERLRSRL
jgi:integrase